MMKRLGLVFSVCLLAGAMEAASAQDFHQPPQVSPREFALMAWGGTPSDPNQLYWMRQAGLNISGFCSPDQLDKVNAAGLTCFASDPRANHYPWKQLPDDQKIRKNVTALVKQIANHPAALGFLMVDEPNASQLPGIGHVVSLLRQAMPSVWSYVNLLPNYTSPSQLGAPNYEAYLQKFIDEVHPAVLSYDNYSLFNGEMLDRFYTNLGAVRRVCLKAHILFWNVIISTSHFTYMDPSGATLRLQAYTTMAYGGRGIEYFTYFAPLVGNYRLAPVDQFGHRTSTWNKLRLLNSQIRELAPWLARLRSTGVYHSAPVPTGENPMSQSRLVKDVLASTYQNPPVQPRYLIGEFVDPDGNPFLMIVNKDLKHSLRYAIQLKQENKHLFEISPYTGKEERFEGEMSWLAPGAGALFEIK
ncbi:MAG TPA: hypothetical protein VMW54_06055 [Terriglobia bacterium]|nr:hypothetical protein [Terriglobia bacterium]